MTLIDRILLCDELSESQFGKLNLIGYNPTGIISINETPYKLQTTLVLIGKICEKSYNSNISLKILFKNLNDKKSSENIFEIVTVPKVPNDETLTVTVPCNWIIEEYGAVEITVLEDTKPVFKESFKIVQGIAPNIRVTEKFKSSGLLPASKSRGRNDGNAG